ncbi:hypothetical protein [Streptomyces californicus]|uniref:hypothetical protein n=1 Tax=Streptomyces californicus TaxID=67351 RepID=UPI0037912688
MRSKIAMDARVKVSPSIIAALGPRLGSVAAFRAQLAEMGRAPGPAAALQAQLRQNNELLASVHSKIAMDAGAKALPSIIAALEPRLGSMAAFRAQLAEMGRAPGPAAALRTQPAKFIPDIGPLADFRSAALLPSIAKLRAQSAAMDPLASMLRSLAEQSRSAFPPQLLRQALGAGTRLLLPDNLRHVRVQLWPWLLRISAKDGVCMAWAPRPELVDRLIALQTSQARYEMLLAHRKEVVEDVTMSLSEVDHPDLLVYRELVEEAVDCFADGRDSAAQALLGNVLDTCMRKHGHDWLTDRFAGAQFTGVSSHKRLIGALATYDGNGRIRPGLFTAYLLVTSLKNAFGPAPKQDTFNRHLAAHHASKDSYRSEFALTAVLSVQALLRHLDGYLWAQT